MLADAKDLPPRRDPAPSASVDAKARALELLRTAYLVLLANHGLASSMVVQQTIDALDQHLPIPDLGVARSFDREWSAEVGRNLVEAQQYLQHALATLGLDRTQHDRAEGKLVGVAESYLDGIFDFVALARVCHNRHENRRLGLRVEALFEAVRLSHEDLKARYQPLPTFDLDTGTQGYEKLSDRVGIVVGSPRFWTRWRWAFYIACPFVLVAAILAPLVYSEHNLSASAPAKYAVKAAASDPHVLEQLGRRVEKDGWTQGLLDYYHADLRIPIRGKKRQATLHVTATKEAQGWIVQDLRVELDGSKSIVLINRRTETVSE